MARKKTQTKAENTMDELVGNFQVLATGAILIYAGYAIVNSVIKDVPYWIQAVLIGLLAIFVYTQRDTVKQFFRKEK